MDELDALNEGTLRRALRLEPAEEHSVHARPLRDPRVWRICTASLFYVATQISLLAFFVLFLHDRRGVSTGVAAGALAVTQVFGGVARIALGRLSDRLRLRIVPLRWVALGLAFTVGITAALVAAPTWIVAAALVEAIAGGPDWPVARGLAAGGWASTTRLARGDVEMGAGILATNGPAVVDRLRDLRRVLDGWLTELDTTVPDADRLRDRLAAARGRLEADDADGGR